MERTVIFFNKPTYDVNKNKYIIKLCDELEEMLKEKECVVYTNGLDASNEEIIYDCNRIMPDMFIYMNSCLNDFIPKI